MFTPSQIRLLTTALTSLIALVVLSAGLLLTTAFLYPKPDESAGRHSGNVATRKASIRSTKPAALTAEQQRGKTLFTNNCAQCHAVTDEVIVGPGLWGATKRVPGEAWLLKWIRNSSAVVASGDLYATTLYNKFNKVQMTSFPNLTDADIRAILSYIDADTNRSESAYLSGGGASQPAR